MTKKSAHVTETPATQWLKRQSVAFDLCPYDYVEHGGTAESARQLGAHEHAIIKTLVMQNEKAEPLVVLMHGDYTVSTKNLARQIACKHIEACQPEVAQRHSGYQIGGTSPFGLRKALPIYVEESILNLSKIWINGGRRGLLVALVPAVLVDNLKAVAVNCALDSEGKIA